MAKRKKHKVREVRWKAGRSNGGRWKKAPAGKNGFWGWFLR